MIKVLLFDFNGVIIDDEPIQMKAYQEVLKEEGIELTEEDYYRSLGMNDEFFVKANYKRVGQSLSEEKTAELVDAKTAKWRDLIDKKIPLFEGVDGFIKRMGNHFTLGLVSMARLPEVEYVLEKTGLRASFSSVVTAEDVETTKPDPECYKMGFRLTDRAVTN
ncbi:MAG: HAD family phosphatase, partial [Pyrinomonadaceae bacterium]|nr:HAD family phosphatase [Pyrinomonadaceae bacterium]